MTTTLVEFWNGTVWTHLDSPSPGTTNNALNAVSCTSITFCMVVGDFEGSTGSGPLTAVWNGRHWSVVKSNTHAGILNGVTCLSSTMCVGAGAGNGPASFENTLIESWNGSKWAVDTSPDPSSEVNLVGGISCAGPTFCVTTGFYQGTGNSDGTLILSGEA
jgi:hypothetical protein